ncbi:transposase subunit [Mycobacteroides abscessus subsp. abscessus]|uniref:Uncharacterized protein n=1 Tax=Brevibacterium casei TaxID=33889 RepID=A0A269ZF57_9MICO|nr:hypothetical protein B8X04_05055 [Brevibacterium casei]SIJ68385.1 transposase subunit [Mycobacteroides abscessus subsp. abscessus]
MESFFTVLQTNVLVRCRRVSPARLSNRIVHRINKTYRRKRRQRRLGTQAAVEIELVHHEEVVLAA